MRTVIYTRDFEPITIVDLDRWQAETILRERILSLAIRPIEKIEDIDFSRFPDVNASVYVPRVQLTAERLRLPWDREPQHVIVFTEDEESALLLKSIFIPGQQSRLNEREREAYARGFGDAILGIAGRGH